MAPVEIKKTIVIFETAAIRGTFAPVGISVLQNLNIFRFPIPSLTIYMVLAANKRNSNIGYTNRCVITFQCIEWLSQL